MKLLVIGGYHSGKYVEVCDPPTRTLEFPRAFEPQATPFSDDNAAPVCMTVQHDLYDLIPLRLGRHTFHVYTLAGMTGAEVIREYHRVTRP